MLCSVLPVVYFVELFFECHIYPVKDTCGVIPIENQMATLTFVHILFFIADSRAAHWAVEGRFAIAKFEFKYLTGHCRRSIGIICSAV